ncbi:MAG: thiosulfate sulfurtransferase [Alphaproteobacteria bacterium]|nr:thiosulfate sulfurtransferase [Alphaproteobacteria bacterium]
MKPDVSRVGTEIFKSYLHDGHEIALFDAREEVPFDRRHLLLASCVPLSRLELMVDALVPCSRTRVVWCDDGEGLADRAAARMAELGYSNVSVLEGGVSEWEAAGYPVYRGVHVPSKAFAEIVEHEAGTPWITAQQLMALGDDNADFVLLDSRTPAEFQVNSIPGAINVPGAELVLRFPDLVPSPDTTVVVHCGGRTRSIIGAQSLIDAGFPNKIVSLKDGTQGWHLAGYDIVNGASVGAKDVSAAGLKAAKQAAERVARRFDIATIGQAALEDMMSGPAGRTTYLIDVRTVEEFEAGHLYGSKHVAGGQLVQETERHLAVWGARVVLVDDNGVRATMTASWLKRMGWDAVILALDACADIDVVTGPYDCKVRGLSTQESDLMAPTDLRSLLDDGSVQVIDLDWSRLYSKGHIPGAWWAIRARIADAMRKMPSTARIVLTSSDGALAELALRDVRAITDQPVFALSGGTDAWAASGFPIEQGLTRAACDVEDIRLRAREQAVDKEAAMRDYLAWEIGLYELLKEDDDHRIKL